MTSTLEQALARIPVWRGHTTLETVFLSGGITNQNYRVDVDGESFVLRLCGAKTALLGIDRVNEYTANRAAADIGIAPEVIAFGDLEASGEGSYLVTRFIRGREIPPSEMRQPATIREVAHTLQKIHALPAIRGTFSPFQVVRNCDALAREYGITAFPENYTWLRERMAEIESRFTIHALPAVFCHNDLLNGNFLRADGHIRILDWEYAGMGDKFFDLANFSAHHEFDDAQGELLLTEYFGQVEPGAFARLQLMQAMSDFREAMWGVLQQGISELDFDFRDYANQFFAKLTARLNDPRYAEWVLTLE